MTAHNFARNSKRKKPIFPAGKEHKRSVTCYKDDKEMQPHQIDICPQIWFRNCCTWQDLVEDEKSIASLLPFTSGEKQESSTEGQKVRKGTIANRICWRACFVSLCLPTCYPCYLCRTVRRSRRQGDILRREELLKHHKNEKLLKSTNDSLNRTLFTQISEVKHRNKTASLEHQMKANNVLNEKTLKTNENNENMKNASELNKLLEEKINHEDVTKNETESDKDQKESETKGDNEKINDDKEDDDILRKATLEKQTCGDKSSKRSNLMNVNVIVLESNYSQIFHYNLSNKFESSSSR